MADGDLNKVLDRLTKLLPTWNYDQLSGAQYELLRLKTELGLLRFDFQQAEKHPDDDFFKEVERKLKEVAHTAEETIDSSLQTGAPMCLRTADPAKELLCSLRKKVNVARDIVKRLPRNNQIGDGSHITGPANQNKGKKHQRMIREDIVVGLEDEEETIFGYLTDTMLELDVVSIIGMPGLGKTTLARKIFTNPRIEYEFTVRIWVCVSQLISMKELGLNILQVFTTKDMSSWSDDKIAEAVYIHLNEENFLLVLDDVRSVDEWGVIRRMLPVNNGASKVLITSREANVGIIASRIRRPHQLRFLTDEECWELLKLEVFGNLSDCPPELEEIGLHIAKQSGGLPLAVTTIGGVLSGQLTRKHWEEVSENVGMYLQSEDLLLNFWELNYNKLTHDLRDCFLYLGAFPENYEIPVSTLINLWTAEEFIQQRPGKTLEEMAEEILNYLIDLNLVMAERRNGIGQVKTCRVRPEARAFCINKASFREGNLFEEITYEEGKFSGISEIISGLRRLCIHSNLLIFLSRKPKSRSLRSLLCFLEASSPINLDTKSVSAIYNLSPSIRVFATSSIKFDPFHKGLTKLVHLRYLTLSWDNLQVLPKTISKLLNLQTLIVDTASVSLTIKANIWRMTDLRHLRTTAVIILENQGEDMKPNKNLQTLRWLSPKSCTRVIFRRAPNLKKLGVRGELATLNAHCWRKLNHLESLKLVNDGESSPNQMHRVLKSFPVRLKNLTLSATKLDWEHLSKLDKITTLEVLKLKNDAFTGETWKTTNGPAFLCLKFLLIEGKDLESWEAPDDSFPSLSSLVLRDCDKLRGIPISLAKSLKKLVLRNPTRSISEHARVIERESAKKCKLIITNTLL